MTAGRSSFSGGRPIFGVYRPGARRALFRGHRAGVILLPKRWAMSPSSSSGRVVESLERRTLLAALFDVVDLGATSTPVGSGVLDVDARGFVLTPDGILKYGSNKLYPSRLAHSGVTPTRVYPGSRSVQVTGSILSGGATEPRAVVFVGAGGGNFNVREVGRLESGAP